METDHVPKMPEVWYDISVPLKQGMDFFADPAFPGEYKLICPPLLMYKGDAGPCRAILRSIK